MLPVSLDCLFLVVSSVFTDIYLTIVSYCLVSYCTKNCNGVNGCFLIPNELHHGEIKLHFVEILMVSILYRIQQSELDLYSAS